MSVAILKQKSISWKYVLLCAIYKLSIYLKNTTTNKQTKINKVKNKRKNNNNNDTNKNNSLFRFLSVQTGFTLTIEMIKTQGRNQRAKIMFTKNYDYVSFLI